MPIASKRLSPVLVVDSVATALPFWADRLGFAITAQVPQAEGGSEPGFAMLEQNGVEVMLQARQSIAADAPALATAFGAAMLFLEVADIDVVERAVVGCDIAVPRRKTFYGATEIAVRTPGGHVVVFAQMGT